MARNVYFSQTVKSEQHLYEDLVIESLKIYGQDVYYLPRTMISRETILNEDIESTYDDAYMIEMYLENVDGFDGEGAMFTKFGLELREQATFVVAKRTWEKLVGFWNNGIISNRPAEGDIVYLPMSKSFFEIKFVEHQQPFYQLSNLPVYRLQCELYEYSGEGVNTGIKELDELQLQFATEYFFEVNASNGTDFITGETVKQILAPATQSTPAVEISGRLLRQEKPDAQTPLRLAVGDITTSNGKYNEFQLYSAANQKLVGTTSGAQWSIIQKFNIDNVNTNLTFVNNAQQAQNRDLEVKADEILDFSEKNPFGDPSDV